MMYDSRYHSNVGYNCPTLESSTNVVLRVARAVNEVETGKKHRSLDHR